MSDHPTDDTRHQLYLMCVAIANAYVDALTNEEILQRCPADYGTTVTDDHCTFVWDAFMDQLEEADALEIHEMYNLYIVRGVSIRERLKTMRREIQFAYENEEENMWNENTLIIPTKKDDLQ